jgi:very-short-patch-repair endonuclease
MKHQEVDRLVGVLADLQHGLVTRQQARETGMTDAQIARRVAQGRWVRCEPHVFRIVGAPVTWHQRVLSVCLATDGVASHRTAAMLLGLGLWPAQIVEVTTDPDRNYRNPDVHMHRSVDDPAIDCRSVEGITLTSVRRTLLDLGSVVPPDRLEKCVERAIFRGMTNPAALWAYIDRVGRQGRRGVQPLRAVLELRGRVAPSESDLEAEMVQLLRRAGLPEPVRQHEVVVAGRRFRVDLAYPALKIALEIDGDEPHFGARKSDSDDTRDGFLQLGGYLTQHFTKRHIRNEPSESVERVREAFRQRSVGGTAAPGVRNTKKTG